MTIQINIGDHVSTEGDFVAIPFAHRFAISWARERAQLVARGMPSANTYFRTLPKGRSLTQLLADRNIWINYGPGLADYGETSLDGKEIGLGPLAFRWGRWTVLGTLIHELAHSNGAPGGHSKAAEEALLHCGLGRLSEKQTGVDDHGTPYSPGIEG